MDEELFLALCVLWLSTTAALITFMFMWFFNDGESFHPHSVDVDQRHSLFVVSNSDTFCKLDCCVKSISAFVAPRGSSSSKQFIVYCVIMSIAGIFGSFRWYEIKDGEYLETMLAATGFASLLLVAAFELDVGPEKFLEDKLLVTGWLIQKMGYHKRVNFNIHDVRSKRFLQFLRNSPLIYHLYDEDIYMRNRSESFTQFRMKGSIWASLHMIGALGYIVCVTAAVLISDKNEQIVVWITGVCFSIFSILGYLTGNYVPLLRPLRGLIIIWNPFIKDPDFIKHLKKSLLQHLQEKNDNQNKSISNKCVENQILTIEPNNKMNQELKQRKSKASKRKTKKVSQENFNNLINDSNELTEENKNRESNENEEDKKENDDNYDEEDEKRCLDNFALRFAKKHPQLYLTIVGYMLAMSELVALLTPAVAMGIQWATALCDEPAFISIIKLFVLTYSCVTGHCPSELNCIIKAGK